MVSPFNTKVKIPPTTRLKPITLREFGGGWNAIDNDVSLSTRFSVSLKNFYRGPDSSHVLRYGTKRFANVSGTVTGNIIDGVYFNDSLVLSTTTGQVARVTSGGVVSAIWNSTIAAALAGAPAGWSSGLTNFSFPQFKGQQIIHNGIDKPIIFTSGFVASYLSDPATGSNVNVPIGKYGCIVANYHCVAGIPASPTVIYISSVGTAGVFPGDPAPNDSISFDIGAYVPEQGDAIRAIAGFRQFLLVFFRSATLVVQLGIYDSGGNHTPKVQDNLPKFGAMSQRVLVPVENELLFSDGIGTDSAKRNIYTTNVESSRLSSLIKPQYQKEFATLTDSQQLLSTFAVFNRLDGQMMLFSPSGRAFVFAFDEELKIRAWSEYNGWTFTAAIATELGRVFFTKGTRVFQYGNGTYAGEDYTADLLGDYDSNWATTTAYTAGVRVRDTVSGAVYTCMTSHTSGAGTFAADRAANPGYWVLFEGDEIAFEWELPWVDGNDRSRLKNNRYINVDSKGTAQFTVSCYVDFLYKNEAGTIIYDPALALPMVAGDELGFGEEDSTHTFGGGRRSNDPRLWSYPVKFKTAKLKFSGSTRKKLRIIAITLLYAKGGYHR